MKTVSEQIKDLENTRAALVARAQSVMQKSIDEGRSSDEEESNEFDEIQEQIKSIDGDLVRLKRLEEMQAANATPVPRTVTNTLPRASAVRQASGPTIIIASGEVDEKFAGQMWTRMVIAKALAHMHQCSAAGIAERRWGKTNPLLVQVIRANEVAGGGTGSGEWGAELVTADGRYTGDFIEYLKSKTVYDRLALRTIPAHVTIKGQDGTATGYWVGESKPIPATTVDFMNVTLTPLKAAALAVVSNELLKHADPSAEMLVRDALADAVAQRVDTTFLSADAAVSGVSPAGLLNGVSAIGSAGTLSDGLRADILALYSAFLTAKNASGLSFVMNKNLAKSISLMVNALGMKEFPALTQEGGTLEGDPVVTGDNVAADDLILLKPSDIYKIGDDGLEFSISRDATIEQNSVPTGASDTPVAASATPVNMFQSESTAIKIVRPLNFAKRRSHAVQYVGNAAYSVEST